MDSTYPDIDLLRRQAKRLLRQAKEGDWARSACFPVLTAPRSWLTPSMQWRRWSASRAGRRSCAPWSRHEATPRDPSAVPDWFSSATAAATPAAASTSTMVPRLMRSGELRRCVPSLDSFRR